MIDNTQTIQHTGYGFMRIVLIWVSCCIILLEGYPALGFYSNGTINDDVTYNNFQVVKSRYRSWVTGTLESSSDETVVINGRIKFLNIHGKLLNSASIYEKIPPYGSVEFSCHLSGYNYNDIQNAYEVVWEINDYPKETKRNHNITSEKSLGYVTTRALDSFVKISGKGKQSSDPFHLKKGTYMAKAEHNGKRHISITLMKVDGTENTLIFSDVGHISESRIIRINVEGNYYVKVYADGNWMVNFEYQQNSSEQATDDTDGDEKKKQHDQNGDKDGKAVLIKLKNGNSMKVDDYWDDGDSLNISIYGSTMSILKKDILEIITTPQANP